VGFLYFLLNGYSIRTHSLTLTAVLAEGSGLRWFEPGIGFSCQTDFSVTLMISKITKNGGSL
jgi:hypothetical protein